MGSAGITDAVVGDRVAYEDMANPLRVGQVAEISDSPWSRFRVVFENGTETWTDGRQCGWKLLRTVRVAGLAGGVGTTLVATVLMDAYRGGTVDQGTDLDGADVVVGRNDYRCAKALAAADLRPGVVVLLVKEPGRALHLEDFEPLVGRGVKLVAVDLDESLARSDDAGLLLSGSRPAARLRTLLDSVLEAEEVDA